MKLFGPSFSFKSKITRINFLWMTLSSEPFTALYALFPFILAKDLEGSAFKLSVFFMIRPTLAVLAYFWDYWIKYHQKHLHRNLMIAWVLAFIPFLLFPLLKHWTFFLVACSCYQLFSKAAMPPFFEIFKQNLDKQVRQKLVFNTYLIQFLISACLGLFLGKILDIRPGFWKGASALFAISALTSVFWQNKLKVKSSFFQLKPKDHHPLITPIKQSFEILKSSKEFRDFQIGFMIGGSALMLISPALQIFFVKDLMLTHENFTQARFIFMALGIFIANPFWKKAIAKYSFNQMMPWITLGFAVYPLITLTALISENMLNIAFMIYGIAQAGSHVIWNLSGTIFSHDKDSTPYTSLNILLQGIRGLVVPLSSWLLIDFVGPIFVIVLGSILAFFGMFVMFKNNKKAQSEYKN